MAAGDVYKLTVQATGLGSIYMNVLAFRTLPATDPVQATWQALADDYKNVMRGSQNASFAYTTWRAVQVFGDGVTYGPNDCKRSGGKLFAGNLTAPLAGTVSPSEPLPPQCAAVLTLTSGFIGRRKRGRIYWYGLSEIDSAAGAWVSSSMTTWTTAWTTFFNKYKLAGTDPNFQLGIWSEREATGCVWDPVTKAHKNVEPAQPDIAFTPAAGYQLRSTVYTQRRRTLGVGR